MKEEAKLILSAYRPGGQDANDPTFATSLAEAAADPELANWFNEQVAFDRFIAQRLTTVSAPPGLRERIRAGVRVSRPRSWWQWPQLWAVAAAIVVIFVVAPHFSPPKRELANWQKHALTVMDDIEADRVAFSHEANDAASLTAWLKSNSAPTPAVPKKLVSVNTWGCKAWNWEGRPISVMCFKAGRNGVHLFSTPRTGLASLPPIGRPDFFRHGHWVVASWASSDYAHMLVGEEGEPMLKQLLVYRGVPQVIAAIVQFVSH